MAGGERTCVRTLNMDDLHFEPATGAELQEEKSLSPASVMEGAEPLTGEPMYGSSRSTITCVPDWKMRILHMIFYF